MACSSNCFLRPFAGLREHYKYYRIRVANRLFVLEHVLNLNTVGQSENWRKKAKTSHRACVFEHYDKLQFTVKTAYGVEFSFGVFWHRFIDQQVYPNCRGTKVDHSAIVTLLFMWDLKPWSRFWTLGNISLGYSPVLAGYYPVAFRV